LALRRGATCPRAAFGPTCTSATSASACAALLPRANRNHKAHSITLTSTPCSSNQRVVRINRARGRRTDGTPLTCSLIHAPLSACLNVTWSPTAGDIVFSVSVGGQELLESVLTEAKPRYCLNLVAQFCIDFKNLQITPTMACGDAIFQLEFFTSSYGQALCSGA
jgi:hypothetical protein